MKDSRARADAGAVARRFVEVLRDHPHSACCCETKVTELRQCAAGDAQPSDDAGDGDPGGVEPPTKGAARWRLELVDAAGRVSHVFAEHVVLALGAEQKAPAPLENKQHQAKLMLANEALSAEGHAKLKARLGGTAKQRVCVVGGAHSAFSVAWLVLNGPVDERDAPPALSNAQSQSTTPKPTTPKPADTLDKPAENAADKAGTHDRAAETAEKLVAKPPLMKRPTSGRGATASCADAAPKLVPSCSEKHLMSQTFPQLVPPQRKTAETEKAATQHGASNSSSVQTSLGLVEALRKRRRFWERGERECSSVSPLRKVTHFQKKTFPVLSSGQRGRRRTSPRGEEPRRMPRERAASLLCFF